MRNPVLFRPLLFLIALLMLCSGGPPALAALEPRSAFSEDEGCFGDCDGDGQVFVDELVILVSIVLGTVPFDSCPDLDDDEASLTITDVIRAVNHLLNDCAALPMTPTATRVTSPPHSPTATATAAGTVSPQPSRLRVTAAQMLRIEFYTTPPFVESLPNTLYALLGAVDRIEPFATIIGSLYDGETLLGVSASTSGCCATGTYSFNPVPVTWRSPGSPWDFPTGAPATVDFTTLHDGSIDGRIDIQIDSGAFELSTASVALRFIHATASNQGSSIPPAPVLRSVRVVAAQPAPPTATARPRTPTQSPSRTPSSGRTPTFDDD